MAKRTSKSKTTTGEMATYECTDCGARMEAAHHPPMCEECGGEMQNISITRDQ